MANELQAFRGYAVSKGVFQVIENACRLGGIADPQSYLEDVMIMLAKNAADMDGQGSGGYAIIRKCEPLSIVQAIRRAAALGLRYDSQLAHAYMVPFGDQATFMVGYKGLMHLAVRDGKVKRIHSEAAYKGDKFTYLCGMAPSISHERTFETATDDDITHVYAVALLANGEYKVEVMTRAEVEKIREAGKARNKGKEGPAWGAHWKRMALKTVDKRLCNGLDLTPAGIVAPVYDEEREVIDIDATVQATPAPVDPSKTKAQRIAESVAATAVPAVDDAPPETVDPNAPLTDAEKQQIRDAEAREAQEQTPPMSDMVTGGKKGKVSKAMMQ